MIDDEAVVPLDDIRVDERLNYIERPVVIMERKMRVLCNTEIPFVKVQWQQWRGSEWIWELEAEMREHYPELFATTTDFEDEVYFKWGRIVTSRWCGIFNFNPICERILYFDPWA